MKMRHLVAGLMIATATLPALAQDPVVYHIDDMSLQALKGLRNIRNHLDVDPTARITVVTHALGVDFLLEGQKDVNGSPFAGPVSALAARGVKFEICEITLKNRNLKKEQFIQEAEFTPSGVVRIAKLQKLGAAYIKP
ncbi:MAG: DsrE family protein [Rubrivivax sp.]|nr:DsrE family protein [Rubrivivax sp.]